MITEYKQELNRLLLKGSFQQAHPADLLTSQVQVNNDKPAKIYTRATRNEQTEQSKENYNQITTRKRRYHTLDISNIYLHLLVREKPMVPAQQHQENYYHTFCHTFCHTFYNTIAEKYHHHTNQCRREIVCCQSQNQYNQEEHTHR